MMAVFIKMVFNASFLIMAIIGFRHLTYRRMPKRFFVLLWLLIPVRLFIPFFAPVNFAPEFAGSGAVFKEQIGFLNERVLSVNSNYTAAVNTPGHEAALTAASKGTDIFFWLCCVWFMVAALLFTAILYLHITNVRRYRESLPAGTEEIKKWQQSHQLMRRVRIRLSDQVDGPVTYGVFSPVILLPSKSGMKGTELFYVLEHEWIHIKGWDVLIKYLIYASAALCWFNPLVWMMTGMVNRDIEIACDEKLLSKSSMEDRKAYAKLLLGMAERRMSVWPLQVGLTGYAEMEERINMILNKKKYTWKTGILASVMMICAVFAFTSKAQSTPEVIKDVQENGREAAQETAWAENRLPSSQAVTGHQIADIARQHVGAPYIYGGSDLSTGTDSTGFVREIYRAAGTELPATMKEMASLQTEVAEKDIEAGDLVFYGKEEEDGSVSLVHAAIYIGGGRIIHSSNVREGVKESDLNYREIGSIIRILSGS